MRLITWNCRIGGFRKKASRIAPLMPDVLAVQEVESIDKVPLFAGESQPTYRDRANSAQYPRRSIGMFSYTGLDIRAVDLPEPTFPFRRFEAFRGSLMFHIVAVWTYESKVRAESYRQAHKGLVEHNAWIRQNPTVVMGDFNQSAKFKSDSWPKLMEITEPLGLVSAYHHYFQEEPGKEMRPTHFHQGKETAPFHLDYVFLPKAWADRITRVEVGSYADWHDLSDHAPLIVDLDLPATA